MRGGHPTESIRAAYMDGELDYEQAEQFEDHLMTCDGCFHLMHDDLATERHVAAFATRFADLGRKIWADNRSPGIWIRLWHLVSGNRKSPWERRIRRGSQTPRLIVAVFSRPAIAMVTAAAALTLIALVSYRMLPTTDTWTLAEAAVDAGLLEENRVRGPIGSVPVESYETSRDAALAGLRFSLESDTLGNFYPWPGLQNTPQPTLGKVLELRFTDLFGRTRAELRATIPVTGGGVVADIQVWGLSLPSRDLYCIPMTKAIASIPAIGKVEASSPLVITYRLNNRFRFVVLKNISS